MNTPALAVPYHLPNAAVRSGLQSRAVWCMLLILLAFYVRAHNITLQGAFLDEGFHAQRGAQVWHFNVNPLAIADGKLLVYYWLGLFQGNRDTALFVSRTAIALFSLLTVATVYRLGSELSDRTAGLLAALLYTFLPLALFHERMALADPLAAGLACLASWHSLILIRRPTLRQGTIQGILLALTTLAKLTTLLLPVLLLVACILYSSTDQPRDWLRRYRSALLTAGVVFVLIWLPLVTASLATATPLLANGVVGGSLFMPTTIPDYLRSVLPLIADFTSPIILIAVVFAVGYLLIWGRKTDTLAALFLTMWIALIAAPLIGFATIPAIRYFVPIGPPLVLLVSISITSLARRISRARFALSLSIVGWLILVGLPFAYIAMTEPSIWPFQQNNHETYFGDIISADHAVREAAATLDQINAPIYADWQLCRLFYFYVRQDVTCLPPGITPGQIESLVVSGAYIALNYQIPLQPDHGLCPILVHHYRRSGTQPLNVWQVNRC